MLLKVNNLSSGYGPINVITDVNLEVREGEIVCIIGRNGAGKTTLLRTIIGLLKATRGSIFFNREDITSLPVYERIKLGMRFARQEKKVFTKLTVRENLELSSYATGDWNIDRVLDLFPRLRRLLNAKAGSLSGGERQMLVLAQTLLGNPRLLLVDEPTEGLAPKVSAELLDALLKLRKQEKCGILAVEQNLHFVEKMADKVLIMKEGKIINEITGQISAKLLEKHLF